MFSMAIILLTVISSSTYGQHILLSEYTPDDFSNLDNDYGPNKKYYIYNFISCGKKVNAFPINNESYLPLRSSLEIKNGTRYRLH